MWFPVIGGIFGVIWVAWLLWIPDLNIFLRALGAVVSEVMLTGALHWDGWADVFDGWGASPDRREMARKDPRMGTMGVLWLIIALMAMIFLWSADFRLVLWPVYFLAPVLARTVASLAVAFAPASEQSQLARWLHQRTASTGALVALFLTVGVTLVLLGPRGLAALSLVALLSFLFVRYWTQMYSGMNGDILGASVIFTEIVTLCLGLVPWFWR